jgi:hypothetical protein
MCHKQLGVSDGRIRCIHWKVRRTLCLANWGGYVLESRCAQIRNDVTGPWCYDDGPQMSEAIRTTETLLVSEDIIYVTRLR